MDVFVGQRIAARRQALGITQTALGRSVGVSFQQIQKYEAGTNRVSAPRLHALARVLAMPMSDFFPPDPQGLEPEDERGLSALARLMTATPEGRAVMMGFGTIRDQPVRQAVARIVEALGQAA